MERTIFIGDVHGCAEEFEEMLDAVAFVKEEDRLFLTGDAFTKGPDPLAVWQLIWDTGAEMVMGNHDSELLEKFEIRLKGAEEKMKPDHKRILDGLMPVVKELVPWLKNLPLYIEEETFLLVHAGINPEQELTGTTKDEFLAIRTWPPIKNIEGPRWFDVYAPIRPLLVFGHDAPKGLVTRQTESGQPYLIGLDSGCVYGNCLSAYILEADDIVQIESKQPRIY